MDFKRRVIDRCDPEFAEVAGDDERVAVEKMALVTTEVGDSRRRDE